MSLHPALTGLDLRLEIHEPGGEAGPGRTYVMQVQLRREWLGFREPGENPVVLDFARGRRLELDEDARTYTEVPLYALVGFRHMELPNREHVRSVIAAGGGDTAEFEPVIAEHQLAVLDKRRGRTIASPKAAGLGERVRSLFSKPERSDIAIDWGKARTSYLTATGRLLLAHSTEGTGASSGLVRRFVQFLRYRFFGHPLILERLASAGRIPRELHYESRGMSGHPGSIVTLRLEAAEAVPDAALVLDGYCRVLPSTQGQPLDSILERVTLGEVRNTKEVVARRMAESEESQQAGRDFESTLTLFELGLETDVQLPSLGGVLQNDSGPAGRQLHGLLSQWPRTRDEARAGVATLLELREPAGRKAHVLMTFEASLRRPLGEVKEAQELLLKAIECNPFLAGAYKDLGDIYLSGYKSAEAWRCWEAARRIAPGHPLLKDVTALEEELLTSHPEYFGP
jgi:hypothetical protein